MNSINWPLLEQLALYFGLVSNSLKLVVRKVPLHRSYDVSQMAIGPLLGQVHVRTSPFCKEIVANVAPLLFNLDEIVKSGGNQVFESMFSVMSRKINLYKMWSFYWPSLLHVITSLTHFHSWTNIRIFECFHSLRFLFILRESVSACM